MLGLLSCSLLVNGDVSFSYGLEEALEGIVGALSFGPDFFEGVEQVFEFLVLEFVKNMLFFLFLVLFKHYFLL